MATKKTVKDIAPNKKRVTIEKGKEPQDGMQREVMTALASALVARSQIASAIGQSFNGDRNLYTTLGYSVELTFQQFYIKYLRQDIAARIIDAPVDATWIRDPEVTDNSDPSTESAFDTAWTEVKERVMAWHIMARGDKLAGIGQYAVLLLGFDDGAEVTEEVTSASSLMYIQPFSETNAIIETYETDTKNERYGFPKTYTLTTASPASTGGDTTTTLSLTGVHWSRVIHIAGPLLENNLFGIPRLQSIYNRLEDLEKVVGGSAEMYWRGAFPGYSFNLADDALSGTQDIDEVADEIEDYIHGLTRYMRLQGMEVQSLAPQVSSPKEQVDTILKLIAGAKGFPVRILTGSERGDLASSQDDKNWKEVVDQRGFGFAEPIMIRPLVDRLIATGVLPEPEDGNYDVVWPDMFSLGEKEQAEIAKSRTEAIVGYANSTADSIIPPEIFMKTIMDWDEETIKEISKELATMVIVESRNTLDAPVGV